MSLAKGTRLGPYEILAPIGAGGMGEVYRATDTRLHRIIAVKVSTDQFTERFEREARAVAALNHSNICQIYDVGPNYLVMEYIEGQPLKGPLPLSQALDFAMKICDALDAAHRRNITHRDLKPANILVCKTGIKLLDFGLAKFEPAVSMGENTMSMALTSKGQILGTLHYMSPEQLQGRDADARSDIFAFGLVLYEMLTGKRAFEGESPASVIAAILERSAPSITAVAPAALDRVLQRCLAKDPDDRWQSARDLKAALQLAAEPGPTPVAPAVTRPRRWRAWTGWVAAAALLAILLLTHPWRQSVRPTGLVRFAVYPPPGGVFSDSPNTTVPIPQFALSPDGRMLVYAATVAGRQMLWLRHIDQIDARPVSETEGATRPFWSPDGRWIGFFGEGALKKIPTEGGHAQVLTGGQGDPRGATWGTAGTVLFGNGNEAIHSISASGGPVTSVSKLNVSIAGAHRWPYLLPDGVHFLFTVRSGLPEQRGVYVGSLDGTAKKLLDGVDLSALYSPPGYLLWVDGSTLMGQTFDIGRLALTGQPFALDEKAGRSTTAEAAVSVSLSGDTLAYAGAILRPGRLTWFDRSGNMLQPLTGEGDFPEFRLSPDDTRLAATLVDPKTSLPAIWLTDLARGATSRFTLGPVLNASPVWSPDGARLIFRTTRNGVAEFYQKSASLGGDDVPVLTSTVQREAGKAISEMITDWSSNGQFLIYSTPGSGGSELWLLPNPGASKRDTRPVRFLSSAGDLMHANFSLDSRLVAYTSNETGTHQVYVQTVPISERKWLVSTTGGYEPRWRADGREIYYLSEDQKLMAVPVGPGPSFGVPKALFRTQVPASVNAFRMHYVPSRDGQHFLINARTGDGASNPIVVVLNWTAAAKNSAR